GVAEVRQMVTIPVEDALSPVKGLEGMRSLSRDGSSVIVLNFRWGTGVDHAAALVREAVDTVYPSLNEGVEKPLVISGGNAGLVHAVVVIRSLAGDQVFERNLAEYEIKARLRRLEGTGTVVLSGGEVPEFHISLDNPKAAALGFNIGDLARLVARETTDVSGGIAREGDRDLVVVSSGRPASAEELSELPLPSPGRAFRLDEVGELSRERARKKSLFIYDNRAATALEIYRRPGTDPVKLSRDIKRLLRETGPLFAGDAELILVYDGAGEIIRDLKNLFLSALLATMAVSSTLMFFLGRIRYSLLAGLSIPLAASAAVVSLALSGRSLNAMSLGGLSLGIGLVSDTAVIVLNLLLKEVRVRRREGAGLSSASIAGAAASVSVSNMAGTITTAIVFVPVIFLPGPLGILYGDLALSLVASIGAAWVYAQFGLPPLFKLLHGGEGGRIEQDRGRGKNFSAGKPRPAGSPEYLYGSFLKKALRRPLPLILGALGLSGLGAFLLVQRPPVFLNLRDTGEIEVSLDFPALTLPEGALEEALGISGLLSEIPRIGNFYGRLGAEDEDRFRRSDPGFSRERLHFRCFLKKGADGPETLGEIRGILAEHTTLPFSAGFPREQTEVLLGLDAAGALAVRGNSREEAAARGEAAAEKLRVLAADASGMVSLTPSGTRPELRVIPDREAMAHAGISVMDLAETLYASTEGIITGRIEIDGRPLEIRLLGNGKTSLEALPVGFPASPEEDSLSAPRSLFLGSLCRIERRESEAAYARQDRSDVVYIKLSLPGGAGVSALINRFLKEGAVRGESGGLSRSGESALLKYRGSLVLTLILVLVLLYLTLGAQFESFLLPLILLLSIPFSLAGAGPSLFLSGYGLDSGSALALAVLFGLAVNNGILLYEVSREKYQKGLEPGPAVFTGSLERFRSVLITTITTLIALIPVSISTLGGSQTSMARTMLGGILASSFLSLFVLPPIFIPFLKRTGR
ncbi:MAG: efflux RND transporter permease subunit, partial [Treponema sp.]|nr:efflux RND transporter permease subunit [Treponema sp.]